jgi:hypothetical protein
MATPADEATIERRNAAAKKRITLAILLGIAIGAAHGIPRYGLFTLGNVAMMGLGIITTLGVYALIVALRPASDDPA